MNTRAKKKSPAPPLVPPGKPSLPRVCPLLQWFYENVLVERHRNDPESIDRSWWVLVQIKLWEEKGWSPEKIRERLKGDPLFSLTAEDATRLDRIYESSKNYSRLKWPCNYMRACVSNEGHDIRACEHCSLAAYGPQSIEAVEYPTEPTWLTHEALNDIRTRQRWQLARVFATYVKDKRGRLVVNRTPTGTGKTTLSEKLGARHGLSTLSLVPVTDTEHKPVARDAWKTRLDITEACGVRPHFLLRGRSEDRCQKWREEGKHVLRDLWCRDCEYEGSCQVPRDKAQATKEERVLAHYSWLSSEPLTANKSVIIMDESPIGLFQEKSDDTSQLSIDEVLRPSDLVRRIRSGRLQEKLLVINDATTPTWFYKALFPGAEVVEITGAAEPMVNATQIAGYKVSKTALGHSNNRDEVYASVVERIRQLGYSRVVLMSFKFMVEDYVARLRQDLPELHVDPCRALGVHTVGSAHFFGLVGTNEFKDYDAAFIVGDPTPNWNQSVMKELPNIVSLLTGRLPSLELVAERRSFRRRTFSPEPPATAGEVKFLLPAQRIHENAIAPTVELGVTCFKDRELQELLESQREGQIVQALGRLRPFEATTAKGIRPVYIYGNFPTEIPVDQVLTRDEDRDELGLAKLPKNLRLKRQELQVREVARLLMATRGEVDIMDVARGVPSLGLPNTYMSSEYGWRKLREVLKEVALENDWESPGSGRPVWKETQTRLFFDVG